jgi:hypothetical protein
MEQTMRKRQTGLDQAVVESSPKNTAISSAVAEQEIVELIQQLWPSARKSSKALGEQLFNLRQLCKDKDAHFNELLESLGIPRSTAYHYIGIFEECRLIDFQFPANVVKFASTANFDITNLDNRKVLLTTFRAMGSPEGPSDSQAIGIVGSAVAAIEEAAKNTNAEPPQRLTPLQQCLAEQDAAFVRMYRVQTKDTKKGSAQRAAAEGQYVRIASNFFNNALLAESVATSDVLLRIGRGQTTLYAQFKQHWSGWTLNVNAKTGEVGGVSATL